MPAALATARFTGAQLYEPRPEGISLQIAREDQETFVIDGNLAMFNLLGTVFAIQVINHSSMIVSQTRRRRLQEGEPLCLDAEPLPDEAIEQQVAEIPSDRSAIEEYRER